MLNDLAVVKTLQKQYDGVRDGFDAFYVIDGDVLWIDETPDYIGFNFEGSHNFLNWWYNFQAVMIYPPELKGAGVEAGFWKNIPALAIAAEAWIKKASFLGKKILIKGHSRGGGMADPFAGLLACRGYTNIENVTFGRPNCGNEALAALLARFPNRSYWNYKDWLHHDPVGDGPPHLLFPFTQTSQRIIIDVPPAANDSWGDALGWHHLSPNYDTGLQTIFQEKTNG